MADAPSAPRTRRSKKPGGAVILASQQPRSAVVAFALLLLGATAAIFLAGGADQGNLGAFLLCAGTALIVCPPRAPVPRGVAWAALVTFLCSAGSLLPARFFHASVWRQAFASAPDLPLPSTVSAAPTQTLFWLAVLALTLLTGVFMLTQPVRSRPLFGLALAAAGVCGIYAAMSIYARLFSWTYPFSGGASFGFLPNRNHTATFLVTGSVLSVGIVLIAFRERWWAGLNLVAVLLALCVTGLCFFSESRGGVIFLLVGVIGWLAGLGGKHRNRFVLLVVAVTVLLAGGMFLGLKSVARDRLFESVPVSPSSQTNPGDGRVVAERANVDITADDRLRIYSDTLGMVRDLPLTGTGLGTFQLVFPPYRQASANPNLILHPESDWLMVAAEAGLPTFACLIVLVVLTLRGWRPSNDHPYWPLRWAFLAAAAAAALHGLVDVPAHRAAVGWWVLILAGLALQPGRAITTDTSSSSGRFMRGVFILGGCVSLVLGGMLIRAEWFRGAPLPPFAAKTAEAEILRLFKRGEAEAAMERARLAVRVSPLSPTLYYQLGVLLVPFEDTDHEIDRAFRLQRLLNPFSAEVPGRQAVAWLPVDPARSAALFAEATARQRKLFQNGSDRRNPATYFRNAIGQAASAPQAQRLLWDTASSGGPPLMLAWLQGAEPTVAREHFLSLATNEEFLNGLNPAQRREFLMVWQNKGDRDARQTFLQGRGAGWDKLPENLP